MSRLQVTLVLTGVIALLSVPPAMGKVDVLKLARRAFTIAERADKATRKPIQTSQVSDGAVTSAKLRTAASRPPTSPTAPSPPASSTTATSRAPTWPTAR